MAQAFTTRRLAGIGVVSFACVLLLGLLAGAGAFFWTLDSADPGVFVSRTGRQRSRDPDPAFSQKVRQMYALGGYTAVVEACQARRDTRPSDPEAYLFAAFALEKIAERPGLEAFEAGVSADRVWEGLLLKASNPDRSFVGNRLYMSGWSQLGLGRPMLANELFGRFVGNFDVSGPIIDSYNRACYLAMAGRTDDAQQAFRRATWRQAIQPGWAEADPDLETLHPTFAFRVWNTYHDLTTGPEWRAIRKPPSEWGDAPTTGPIYIRTDR